MSNKPAFSRSDTPPPVHLGPKTTIPMSVAWAFVAGAIATTISIMVFLHSMDSDTEAKIEKAVNAAFTRVQEERKEEKVNTDLLRRAEQDALNRRLDEMKGTLAALQSAASQNSEQARIERAQLERRLTLMEQRLEIGTSSRYTAIQASEMWRDAERLNTMEKMQENGGWIAPPMRWTPHDAASGVRSPFTMSPVDLHSKQ